MAYGRIKHSRAKARRAYRNSTKEFKHSMKVRTVTPVFRTDGGYAAYVCLSARVGKRRDQCYRTAFASTPTRAIAKAHALFAKGVKARS